MENVPRTHEDIEAQIRDIQAKKKEVSDNNGNDKGVGLGESGYFDSDIYDGGGNKKYEGYVTSIAANDEADDDDEDVVSYSQKRSGGFNVNVALLNDVAQSDKDYDPFADRRRPTIAEKEDEYRQKRRRMIISPERVDLFAEGGKTPDFGSRTYTEIMKEQLLKGEEVEVRKKILEKAKEGTLKIQTNGESKSAPKKRGRWDQTVDESPAPTKKKAVLSSVMATPTWDNDRTPADHRWDETPGHKTGSETPGATPGQSTRMWDATPGHATPGAATPGRDTPGHAHDGKSTSRRNRWDETPKTERETPGHNSGWAETPRTDRVGGGDLIQETPTPGASKRRSRWDETPSNQLTPSLNTPSGGMTPQTPHGTPHATPGHTPSMGVLTPGGSTPIGVKAMAMATPTPGHLASMTPEQLQAYRWEREIDERNRPYSDEELDALFPPGFKVLQPPAGYIPIRTPARKLTATPTPIAGTPTGFFIQQEDKSAKYIDNQPKGANLPFMKPEDAQYFDKLLVDVDEESLSPEEQKERKIMKLLLKIKNGTPPMRKAALRQITDKAREFGAGPLFNQILPLLMSPTLEDQERHLLVKVIDRILYKLDDLVRPYVHKILVVIEPLLIDEDYYARVEGREIISNLAKAAGLATMISTMRPDIDNIDEYVRNTTARAFAVVASALGIPSLLPFLKAVCRSKKSWQARHTGIKIVQQIAILMGCAILPHLKSLVEIIEHGLVDEQQKVRTITALAIAALAEAATPYGIESFDSVLKPLWKGIRTHRGKGLAAFLKAIGYLIPLMDAEYANYYTREVMLILIREFQSPDEEMKKIVLKVVKQCCGTDGVESQYIKEEILPSFFKHFWNHRMALDRRNYRQLVDTTVEIANKVGASEIINRVVDDLKDENEQYRKMVMETIEKIMGNLGAADIDSRLEEQLIDGILYAFQEQTTEDVVMLNGFGTIVNQLGKRVKPYLPQICGTILWRLNNKSAKVRQQAADLISRIAVVMKTCQEEKLMGHLGVVLYEYLGEEYPEVLGSILGALKAIVNVIGMTKMTPPIKDLLPRLTPILKNRHEKVQENCIDLVGRIADRGPEYVSAREWMRICFELLELLKAHKKAIRRATVNTFGYIAKAIGPHDVLATLLNNLKVQERQNRVCTTVAIAIVAETCSPFTVLPALMNEYRVPELNVQNGVLKSLSFLFEYIGEMGKDYIYAVSPLLEDALMDRDLVHRQTACAAIKHMALGVYGFGCEDALIHLLNYVWPNIFETSPHLVQAFMDAIEGMRVALGPIKILQYTLQGLFHPARKVRDVYWKIYNSLYIGGQDALVAGYPRISNDPKNQYIRYELDYVL
ncbi:splicing factor 3B subunit 1 [Chrysoperla carnea]|uniref:splicing factor 3B subunit 1 n=1 Tax=Chrysoperla carnea TaxID=189513 RepID=UPI001D0884BD|nr:splicing factor 3B subunit 1 [Chrysoperla carnea]XP_044726975.1 splicing factor 3B subunit 1 [Chrysoperla carnea]